MTIKFIRVTEVHRDGSTIDMLVNTENILSVKMADSKTDTHIGLRDGKYLFVQESTEAIWNMINLDYSKSPVLMTADEYTMYLSDKWEKTNGMG